MSIDPHAIDQMAIILLGFAFAGALASGFELACGHRVSFRLLQGGDLRALASVPVLVFSAPVVIIRNLVRARPLERRPVLAVAAGTVIACFWSLACGRLVLDAALYVAGA